MFDLYDSTQMEMFNVLTSQIRTQIADVCIQYLHIRMVLVARQNQLRTKLCLISPFFLGFLNEVLNSVFKTFVLCF